MQRGMSKLGIRLLLGALLVSSAVDAAPARRAPTGPDAAARFKAAGDELRQAGSLDAALAQYEKAVDADATHVPAIQELGRALYAQERFDEAEAEFRKLVDLTPDDPVVWYNLGYALRKQKNFVDATAAFEKYIAAHPTDPDGYYALAECLRVRGLQTEAAAQYDLYVEKETRPGEETWVEKAKAKAKELRETPKAVAKAPKTEAPHTPAEPPTAIADATPAQQPETTTPQRTRDPTGAMTLIRDGDRLFQQKRFSEALKSYEDAIRLDDQSTNAILKAGLALANLGEFGQAIERWERVLVLDPSNRYAPGYIERAKPRLQTAVASTSPKPVDATTAQPTTSTAQPSQQDIATSRDEYRKAVALINASRFSEALAPLQTAIEKNPTFVNAFVARGGAYLGLRRYDDAAADYRRSLELNPALATPLYGLARVYETQGDKVRAVEFYRRYAASNGPDAQPALKRRALETADALAR